MIGNLTTLGVYARRALALLFFFIAAEAAEGASTARIGVLLPTLGRAQSQSVKGLKDELKRLGFVARKNFFVETRNANGNRSTLPSLAGDLVARRVDAIFTTGTRATLAAIGAAADIPIVFVHPGDPVTAGLVRSLTNPPRNVTGIAAFGADKTERRMALLKELIPGLREVYIFFDTNNNFSRGNFARAQAVAKKLGLLAVEHGVKSADELKTTFSNLRVATGAALFQVSDDLVEGEAEFIFTTARRMKLPSMFNEESWAIQGATAAYGPSYLDMGRRAGAMIAHILKNPKSPLPAIEHSEKFDFIVNYRAANYMGFLVPQAVLKRADKVIR